MVFFFLVCAAEGKKDDKARKLRAYAEKTSNS